MDRADDTGRRRHQFQTGQAPRPASSRRNDTGVRVHRRNRFLLGACVTTATAVFVMLVVTVLAPHPLGPAPVPPAPPLLLDRIVGPGVPGLLLRDPHGTRTFEDVVRLPPAAFLQLPSKDLMMRAFDTAWLVYDVRST